MQIIAARSNTEAFPAAFVSALIASKHASSEMNGWRFIGLYFHCLLLSALAVALAAIIATAPYWIGPT